MARTWKRTVAIAKADPILVAVAAAIRVKNVAAFDRGGPADTQVERCAFKDRAMELGLKVPNDFYWRLMIGACMCPHVDLSRVH